MDAWDQGLMNYDPLSQAGPAPVFLNKVLLEHNYMDSFVYNPWLP